MFAVKSSGSTVGREVLAGATTYLTMVYIVIVNPAILGEAGMDTGAVFVATCLAAALGSLLMGVLANYPIALAPGMGLNAFFTYGVVLGMGHSWQTALGAVFLSGLLFLILSLLPVREWLINSIPVGLKKAISAGIGLFLFFIGLQNAGLVADHPQTLVTAGSLQSWPTLLALLGFVVMTVLHVRGFAAAILVGMAVVTGIGAVIGLTSITGWVSMPPDLTPTLMAMDLKGALEIGLLSVVFVFFMVDFFDSAGTLIGVAHTGGLLDKNGNLPRARRALVSDSVATMAGAALGTSTTTSYIESAAGIEAGGRTGLTAVVVAGLFVLTLFLSPLAASVPGFATAPALMFVGCLMVRGLADIDWQDASEFVPAVLVALAMPLTFSISTGIGIGFLAYTAIKVFAGRWSEISLGTWVISALFVIKFAWY